MIAADHADLQKVDNLSDLNKSPVPYVRTLSVGHSDSRSTDMPPVYQVSAPMQAAKSEVTGQPFPETSANAAYLSGMEVENARAVIANTPLDSAVKDKDIARNFNAAFAVRFARVIERLRNMGFTPKIGSGVRRYETQLAQKNPLKAGTDSLHLRGEAADVFDDTANNRVKLAFYRALHLLARQNRLQTVAGRSELPHIQLPRWELSTQYQPFVVGVLGQHPHRHTHYSMHYKTYSMRYKPYSPRV